MMLCVMRLQLQYSMSMLNGNVGLFYYSDWYGGKIYLLVWECGEGKRVYAWWCFGCGMLLCVYDVMVLYFCIQQSERDVIYLCECGMLVECVGMVNGGLIYEFMG